jgi:hypothetical protein
LDGISHLDAPGDSIRDEWMHRHGLRVLRIPNLAVFRNLAGIVVAIEQIAGAPPPPNPLPQGEGESSVASASTSSTAAATVYLDV